MKKIIDEIWIFLSPILQAITWLFSKLELEKLSIISQLMTIYLLALGISEMHKRKKDRNSNHKFKSKAEKNTNLALDPEAKAEELVNTIKIYKKAGNKLMINLNKIFKWVWGNKYSLTTLITQTFTALAASFVVYVDKLYLTFPFLTSYKSMLQVITPLVAVAITIIYIFILVKRCFDSNMTIEEYKQLTTRKKELKALIEDLKAKIAPIKAEYENARNIVNNNINTIQSNSELLSPDERANYYKAYNKMPTLQKELDPLNTQLKQIEVELADIELKI